ncbi:MAG: hypothetical protein Q4B29_00585 [Candidatus Saccharibacteria bacterium]|nr:hypothetical protein [Candidatus Saccharibacteria bacterium]
MKTIQKNLTTVTTATLLTLTSSIGVSAWGPERPTYTNEEPAKSATFNSITNNAAVGDERDFVRIEEKSSGRAYSSNIEIEAGKQYEVFIYYHNDASATFNSEKYNFAGVARDVRLSSNFPDSLAAGETGQVVGTISSSTTTPAKVWDEANITAKEAVTLHYVEGSAIISNSQASNGSVLPTSLFSDTGTFLSIDYTGENAATLAGLIPGCDEYSGVVTYTIQTKAVEGLVPNPEDPTPEDPTPEEQLPDEIVKTGPLEITLAILIILGIGGGFFYLWKTRKTLKTVEDVVSGKDVGENSKNS